MLQAVAIALLLHAPTDVPFDSAGFVSALQQVVSEPAYQQRQALLADLDRAAPPEQLAAQLGNGIAAHESVPTALACFLHAPSSFVSVIDRALRIGGGTDTIAAMAGTLAGVYLGADQLPQRWCAQVEAASRLCELADQLFATTRQRAK